MLVACLVFICNWCLHLVCVIKWVYCTNSIFLKYNKKRNPRGNFPRYNLTFITLVSCKSWVFKKGLNPRKTSRFLFPVGEIQFFFNITLKMGLALKGGNFPGVTWVEREAKYSSPSWSYTSIADYITIWYLFCERPCNCSVRFNGLKTERNLLYIKNQSVPRSKHLPLWL
jgi:hypothetical protein